MLIREKNKGANFKVGSEGGNEDLGFQGGHSDKSVVSISS